MEFKDLIKSRRMQLNKTLEEVGNAIGVSKATVQRWESGEIKNIRRDKIAKLAKALDVSPHYIMGWENDAVLHPSFMPVPKTKKVPLLGTIACGTPILAQESIEEYFDAPENIQCDFCLRCKGDSMINARINDGDLVFVKKQASIKNGDIAVVLLDDEATLKRVKILGDTIALYPENFNYEPIFIKGEQLDHTIIQGKAVAFLSVLK